MGRKMTVDKGKKDKTLKTKQWEQQMQRASTDANLSKYQSQVHDKLIIESEKQKDALKNQQLSLETKLKEQQEAFLLQYQMEYLTVHPY